MQSLIHPTPAAPQPGAAQPGNETMTRQDGWKGLTARKRGYNVQVQCTDVSTRTAFWGRCSTFTTRREAIADAAERTATGKVCRVVDFDNNEIA